MTTEEERKFCEQIPRESNGEWLVRMLEFHRNSREWFIQNPQSNEYLGDKEFHQMVYDRYERMIAIALDIV